jgi:two-component system, NtrC family, sensor kinase
MKSFIKISLLLLLPFFAKAQSQEKVLDSLHAALKYSANDTAKMRTLYSLNIFYSESNRDSAMYYIEKGIAIANKFKQPLWVAEFLILKAYILQKQSNYSLSFKLCNEALEIIQDKKNEKGAYIPPDDEFATDVEKFRISRKSGVFHQLGNTYNLVSNPERAIEYFKKVIMIHEEVKSKYSNVTANMNIGSIYFRMGKLDSALIYSNRALENANGTGGWKKYSGFILTNIGNIYLKRGLLDSAKTYFKNAIKVNKEQNNLAGEIRSYNAMASFFEKLNQPDSMLFYASQALLIGGQLKDKTSISTSSSLIAIAWKMKGNADSALVYLTIAKTLSDSLNTDRIDKINQFQNSNFEEQMRLEKDVQKSIAYKNKIRTFVFIGGLGLLSLLAIVFYRNNRQKQKANTVLESTLNNLKSTQSQLIQSEKMASLGELTAGIAHEIQNPLNFVNNFSEVSTELVKEMVDEVDKGNTAEVKAIANDVVQNLEKINYHGQRAADIVKGMLQHSRSSSGVKEPTDINALCDEYLRLAYHGLRAKDKNFNAKFETIFDASIGKINIQPQEMGRVILNLINNAFYAVSERQKVEGLRYKAENTLHLTPSTLNPAYEPTVTISTKKTTNGIEIKLADNGTGIPQKAVDKIFQPFFTTKPTGQGTGLGLSLSYDIITKAHGGTLTVETKQNEGTTFIINLPNPKA